MVDAILSLTAVPDWIGSTTEDAEIEPKQDGDPLDGDICGLCIQFLCGGGWGMLCTKDEIHSLGIPLGPVVPKESEIMSVVWSAYFHLGRIPQLRPYLVLGSHTLGHAWVISRIDHCNVISL